MFKITITKEFTEGLKKLRDAESRKVKAALYDASFSGRINLRPSENGENRIPNVEKYMVSDGDRLVVQLIDPANKVRVFLFVGTHDETQRWLDSHADYRWVEKKSDSKIEFVQVTDAMSPQPPPTPSVPGNEPVKSPQATNEPASSPHKPGSILGFLEAEEWGGLALRNETKDFLKSVDQQFMLTREDEVLERLPKLEPEKRANLLYDLLCLAAKGDFEGVKQRLALHKDEARIIEGAQLAAAMQKPVNSEDIITFDDANTLQDFLQKGGTIAEWMFFLHPSQSELVNRDFNGPARLRGISGSGKTCVLLHRARRIAKVYREPVLVVTLTESMHKLLDSLLDDLCGVERQLIVVATVNSTVRNVIESSYGERVDIIRLTDIQEDKLLADSVKFIRTCTGFSEAPFRNFNSVDLTHFIRDEFSFVRSRLIPADYQKYVEPESFPRRGRGLALNRKAREVVLQGLYFFETELEKLKAADGEAITQAARSIVADPGNKTRRYRSVLVDEVQDLSQLELEIMANFLTSQGEPVRSVQNGFFLVGDGTQTIYRRGFRLVNAGVAITGRSYYLKKNYRNTKEILQAGYALVSHYEFADSDESDLVRPLEPDYASRRGAKPTLVKCRDTDDEAAYVVATICLLCSNGIKPGQICVIGCNKTIRDSVKRLLSDTELPFVELREDVKVDSQNIKVSTIESAKGHEFHTVFIAGLVEGVMPPRGTDEAEIPREVARLYVAITRAQDFLHLSYSYTPAFPASRFLIHFQDHCEEKSFVNGQLRNM
jgi:superfamily I DNA/RNA helicase/mRNA-degrading endonuclease RelE of RelBE toxin-antitoxin system